MRTVTKHELARQTAKVLAAVDAEGPVIVTERGAPRWRISAIGSKGRRGAIGPTEDEPDA